MFFPKYIRNHNGYLLAAWVLLGGLTLLRLVLAGTFNLLPDEAYYWQWSRYLSWGYHDHPPMVAWAIGLATWLAGNSEAAVRLPAVLSLAGVSAYGIVIARRWYGPRAAWYTAVLSQSVLLFNVGALIVTPDSFQALAWAGAAYHLACSYETGRPSQWLLTGLWFGIGMLSKLSMALFPPLALAAGLTTTDFRRRLKSIWPHMGFGAGLLIWTPFLVWNAEHGWRAIRHVGYQGGLTATGAFHLQYLGDYLLSQVALLSPLVFGCLVAAWWGVLRCGRPSESAVSRLLLLTSLPVFLVFALLSLHTRVEGNWPGYGYLTGCVLTGAFFANRHAVMTTVSRLWQITLISSWLVSAVVLIQVAWPVFPLDPQLDRTVMETAGWPQLAHKAAQLKTQLPVPQKSFIFALRYQEASELAYYCPGRPRTLAINRGRRPNAYDYWWQDDALLDQDAVGVAGNPDERRHLQAFFQRVDPPIRLDIHKRAVWPAAEGQHKAIKTYYLYKAYGYKGGHRWRPENADDIRG